MNKILEIIKGYEPVKNDEEFGFYWEYEDMEKCATEIAKVIDEGIGKDEKTNGTVGHIMTRLEDVKNWEKITRNQFRQELREYFGVSIASQSDPKDITLNEGLEKKVQ